MDGHQGQKQLLLFLLRLIESISLIHHASLTQSVSDTVSERVSESVSVTLIMSQTVESDAISVSLITL